MTCDGPTRDAICKALREEAKLRGPYWAPGGQQRRALEYALRFIESRFPVGAEPSPEPMRDALLGLCDALDDVLADQSQSDRTSDGATEEAARLITQAEATIQMGIDSAWLDRGERFRLALDDLRRARAVLTTDQSPSGNAIVYIARCPEHGLHGDRTDCFVCQGPVERVAMIPLGAPGGAVGERAATKEGGSAGD